MIFFHKSGKKVPVKFLSYRISEILSKVHGMDQKLMFEINMVKHSKKNFFNFISFCQNKLLFQEQGILRKNFQNWAFSLTSHNRALCHVLAAEKSLDSLLGKVWVSALNYRIRTEKCKLKANPDAKFRSKLNTSNKKADFGAEYSSFSS